MFLQRCHLRFDGVYVSRNTYIRTGIVEWKIRNPCHLVAYYRYYRFMPDGECGTASRGEAATRPCSHHAPLIHCHILVGLAVCDPQHSRHTSTCSAGTFLYRTSPETLSRIAHSLLHPPRTGSAKGSAASPQPGRWRLLDNRLYCVMRYDNRSMTEIRSRLSVRSTVPGANNRLDVQSIVSYDREEGVAAPMLDMGAQEEALAAGPQEQVGVEQRTHRRGLSPFIFVPFDKVDSSPINLPVAQMDYFLA